MNKYEIALEVYFEYCEEVHWAFESPAERFAIWMWLTQRKNSTI